VNKELNPGSQAARFHFGNISLDTVVTLETTYTGWGKITSLNFKVNSKKTIRDTKILFLDSETTIWVVLNHIVLKRISCVY
jgi:hypothetical protein